MLSLCLVGLLLSLPKVYSSEYQSTSMNTALRVSRSFALLSSYNPIPLNSVAGLIVLHLCLQTVAGAERKKRSKQPFITHHKLPPGQGYSDPSIMLRHFFLYCDRAVRIFFFWGEIFHTSFTIAYLCTTCR